MDPLPVSEKDIWKVILRIAANEAPFRIWATLKRQFFPDKTTSHGLKSTLSQNAVGNEIVKVALPAKGLKRMAGE
jgi:hypothetical protein